MTRNALITATMSVVLSAVMLPSTHADEFADSNGGELPAPPLVAPAPLVHDEPGASPVNAAAPVVSRPALYRQPVLQQVPMAINADAQAAVVAAPIQQPGYVRLGAPLYPSPVPNVPIWAGSTMITSPALAPHEMLYPHTYRAVYPPYYHRVKGGWLWTPFGMRSHEKWELQGTKVTVKYRSSVPLWVNMSAPALTVPTYKSQY